MNDVVTYLYMTVVSLYIHVCITVALILLKVDEKLRLETRDRAKKTRTEITDDKV